MEQLKGLVGLLEGGRDPVIPQTLAKCAVTAGVQQATISKVLELDSFRDMDMIMPREVIIILITMSGRTLKDVLSSIFEVFCKSAGVIDCPDFVDLFNILAYQDQGTLVSEALREEVEKAFVDLPPVTLSDIFENPSISSVL